jgi:hypothetical protein
MCVTVTDLIFARWEANEMMINVSCDALGYSGVPNPSREELDGIVDAISAESKDSGLDERFLLAIMVSLLSVSLSLSLCEVIDANQCAADARVQRLRASKVHIVAGRSDQESWADASKYKASRSCVTSNDTDKRFVDTQRHRQLQRKRRHGRSLSRQRNQTDDPRRHIRHRSRRRSKASVSRTQNTHPSISRHKKLTKTQQARQSHRRRRSPILPRITNVQRRLRRPFRRSRQRLLHEMLRVRYRQPTNGLGESEPQLPSGRRNRVVTDGTRRRHGCFET